MKLELGKSYKTLGDYKATVLDVNFRKYADNLVPCAVVKVWINDHEEVYSYNLDGSLHGSTHLTSLGITSEWDDLEEFRNLPVDAPIWVRGMEDAPWVPRHFARVENGQVFCWVNGATRHTVSQLVGPDENQTTRWEFATTEKPEELI